MIHFFDPSNEKMAAKIPDMVGKVDVLLGNLEDAVKADNKEAAREGSSRSPRPPTSVTSPSCGPGSTPRQPVGARRPHHARHRDRRQARRHHGPKVQGPEDIHYVDRLLAQLEAKAGLTRPILVHAILETARGRGQRRGDLRASPRMQGSRSARPTWPPTAG
jgi:malyl-CoA/(S)-citramalyl-CoA lyase